MPLFRMLKYFVGEKNMKKIRSKLSLVLLLILSFVVMLGATASMLVSADIKANDEPAAVEVYSDDWYEITITDNSLTILISSEIGTYRSLSRDDLANIKKAAKSAITTLVVEKILQQGGAGSAEPAAIRGIMPLADGQELKPIYARYRTYLTNRLSKLEKVEGKDGVYYAAELDKFLAGQYDAFIEYAATRYVNDSDHTEAELKDLMKKVHSDVWEIIEAVLNDLANREETIYISGGVEVNTDTIGEISKDAQTKLKKISQKVYDNEGQMDFGIEDLIEILYSVKIGDYQIFNGERFVLSQIKDLIFSLPKPAEIVNMADEDMNLSYDILIETTLGDVEFNFTLGFMGDSQYIRRAAQFIADHISGSYDEESGYTFEVTTPEAFSALLLKLSNTSRIPDRIKLAVFNMFTKTGDEIFDKATSYSYQEILEYLKGNDFQGLFAGLLDAQRIRDFLSSHGVDVSKLTDENIDRVINKILYYAEKVANKQTVEGVEEFLESIGIPVGIPSQFEGVVQKFLNLLNKIDYKYHNAETIREFLNDNGRFNAKVDALLTRLANSATTEKIYNELVELAESAFNKLPERIHNSTILDLYRGNGELSWAGNVNFDLKEIITKVINKLVPYAEKAGFENIEEYTKYVEDFIDSYIEGELEIDFDLSLTLNLTSIYKVEYVVNGEVVRAGLLPVGADVLFYANMTTVNGLEIVAWVDEDGNEYTEMPAKDITLYAVTAFEAYIAVDGEEVTEIEKVYDGESVVLTVEIDGAVGANPTFTWYKNGEVYKTVNGIEGATLELVNVADSGVYYCVVENTDERFGYKPAQTQEVTVTIKKATADFTVSLEGWTYGEDANEPEITGDVGDGEVTYLYEGNGYSGNVPPTKAGTYTLTVTAADTDNYNGGSASCEFTIEKADLDVTVAPESVVYNGRAQSPEITVIGVNGEVVEYEVTYNGSKELPKNVGEYTIVITLLGDAANNYNVPAEYTFTITEATAAFTVSLEGWTYGEDANDPEITGDVGDGEVTYLYEGNGYSGNVPPTNAGTYTLTVTAASTENYIGGTASCTFTIDKADLGITVAPESAVYNGEEQKPEIIATGVNGALVKDTDYTITYYINNEIAEEVKNVGEYTIVITLLGDAANNYNAPAEYIFTIVEATADFTVSLEGWTYGEDANEPVINGDVGDGEVTYIYEGINGTEYAASEEVPTNAGEYKLTVTVTSTENYIGGSASCTFIIAKADLDFTVSVEGWIYGEYDANVNGPKFTGNLGDGEITYLYEGEGYSDNVPPTNAGTYTLTVTVAEADNYNERSYTCEFTVEKAELDFTVSLEGWTYGEDANEPKFTGNLGDGEITYLYEGEGYSDNVPPTNAGTYTLTVTVAESDNYNGGTASCTFTIAKAELDFSGATWVKSEEYNYYVYDGETKSIEFRHSVVIPADVEFEVVGNTGVDAGTYYAYIVISYDENNYNVILPATGYDEEHAEEWEIAQATLDVSGVELVAPNDTVEFDGENHFATYNIIGTYPDGTEFELVVKDADGNVVEEAVNVGEYTATLTISTTNPNYKVDEYNYQIIRIWEITSAIIDLTEYRVSWNYDYRSPFEFDGEVHTVKLVDETVFGKFLLAAGYTFGYVNNSTSEVGTYTAIIVIVDSNGNRTFNYDVIGYQPCEWQIIDGIELNFEGYAWTSHEGFVYDKDVEYSVKLVNADGEDVIDADWGFYEGYSLQYFYASETNAGIYYAYIAVVKNGKISSSYVIVGLVDGTVDNAHAWTIEKQVLEIEEPVFSVSHNGETLANDAKLVYDGIEYAFAVAHSFDEEIFEVEVTYVGSNVNAGTYTITVTVVLKDADNYIYNGKTVFTHSWTIEKQVLEIEEPVFSVKHNGAALENDATLVYDGIEYEFAVAHNFNEEIFEVEVTGVGSYVNAGTYTITVTVVLTDADNYVYNGKTVFTHSWTIEKATIDDALATIVIMQYGEVVKNPIYNGDPYYVKILYPEEQFDITVTGTTEATDARSYYVTIILSPKNPDNYVSDGVAAFTYLWEIAPETVESVNPALVINGNKVSKVVYDKDTVYNVEVDYNYDAEMFAKYFDVVEVSGDLSAKNVGIYTVTIKLAPKFDINSYNYRYYGRTEFTLTWEITKAKIDDVIATFKINGEEVDKVTYNNEAYSVSVTYNYDINALKELFDITVTGDLEKTEAGTYAVKVALTLLDSANYNYRGQTEFNFYWQIAQKVVTLSTEPQLKQDNFIYSGAWYTVELDEATLDPMFSLVSINGTKTALNAGTYSATIVIALKDTKNYIYEGQTEFDRTWTIKADESLEIVGGKWKVVNGDWEDKTNHTVTFNGEVYQVIYEFDSINIAEYSIYYEGVRKATNAGVYEVHVAIVSADGNHSVKDCEDFTLIWEIKPQVIDLAGYTWTDSSNFAYNEGPQSVVLAKNGKDAKDSFTLAAGYSLEYYGATATNAGTYYAYIALVAPAGGYIENYVITNLAVGDADNTYEWSIATKELSITEKWIGEHTYVFDGTNHVITFNAGEYASYVDIKYVNNEGVNVGSYVAVAKLTVKNSNYTLAKDAFEYEWSITAKTFKLNNYVWSATELEYNGSEQTITLVDAQGKAIALNLAAGYSLQYVGNKAENVGVYEAFVIIVDENGETGNYILSGNTSTAWSIVKKVITVETSWSATTEFDYDGNAHGVNLTVSGDYADYVTVSESNNSATEAGSYVAVAELTLKAEYTANYELSKSVYTLSWKIKGIEGGEQPPVEQGNTRFEAEGGDLPAGVKVTVVASEPLPDNAALKVKATPNSYSDEQFQPFVAEGTIPKIVRVYGIEIENIPENYGGSFTVTIYNSEFEGKDLIVVHIPLDDAGAPLDREEWERLDDAALAGKNMTFTTPGFSDFAVVEQVRVNDNDTGSILWLMWLMLVIILLLLLIIIILVIKLLRDNGEPVDDEDDSIKHPVVIIKTIEEAVEEEKQEDEHVVVEESDDEDLDDKSAALLIEDASEDDAQPIDGNEDPLVAADGSRIIYDRSFTARLIQSDSSLKDFYAELKNYILSYKGVKSRISWHFDSFNLGREKCVKIQFRGKSMYLYFPLTSAEVSDKYNVTDVSEMSRYEGVPTMFKVRKPRTLKYAKELIDMVMNKLGVEQGEIPNVKYRPRYRTTNSLIGMGLIKVKTTNSAFFAAKLNKEDNK